MHVKLKLVNLFFTKVDSKLEEGVDAQSTLGYGAAGLAMVPASQERIGSTIYS